MGRRKQHNEQTAAALLDVAERAVALEGVDALSLRNVARDAGTTTRAVYTLFGSKDALLGALGVRAFNLLQREAEASRAKRNTAASTITTTATPAYGIYNVSLPVLWPAAFFE